MRNHIFFTLVLMFFFSCKGKEIVIPTEAEVDEFTKEYFDAGQDLTEKQEKKMEKMIVRYEKLKKKDIRAEEKAAKKKGDNSKWLKWKRNRIARKQVKLKRKVQKYHIKINIKRQDPKTRRRMKKKRRAANRRYNKKMRKRR